MRIAFDAKRLFHNTTGLGNYSRDLVGNLAHFYPENEYYLYSPTFSDLAEAKPFKQPPFQGISAGNQWKAYWRSRGVVSVLKRDKPDIFHGLSHELPFGLKKTGIKSVVTVHDLIFKLYPSLYGVWDRFAHDYKCKYACATADKIVAISEQTRQDLMQYYEVAAAKIEVVTPMCHPRFGVTQDAITREAVRKKYGLPDNYLLYVGSIIERKNLLTILKSLQELPAAIDLPLVVVGGGKNAYRTACEAFIQKNNLGKRVIFPPFISSDDLPAVYQGAAVFLYPSVYEGFGMPVIEAIKSGTPAIISEHGALREAGGSGAISVPAFDANKMAEMITKLVEDTHFSTEIVNKGRVYVEKYEPKVVTDKLFAVYQSLL